MALGVVRMQALPGSRARRRRSIHLTCEARRSVGGFNPSVADYTSNGGRWILQVLQSFALVQESTIAMAMTALSPEQRLNKEFVEARVAVMGNLVTALALLLGIEIAQLSAVSSDDLISSSARTSGPAVVAVVAASIAVLLTVVGLGFGITFQMLAGQIDKGKLVRFIDNRHPIGKDLDFLYNFPTSALTYSFPFTIISLACYVCVFYHNHWSALLAAAFLILSLILCVRAYITYKNTMTELKDDMQSPETLKSTVIRFFDTRLIWPVQNSLADDLEEQTATEYNSGRYYNPPTDTPGSYM